jgi:Flp pilus assembly protein TadG
MGTRPSTGRYGVRASDVQLCSDCSHHSAEDNHQQVEASDRVLKRSFGLVPSDVGSAVVEMAIIVPVLVLLAIGVAEFGRVYFTSITVANASTAGSQYASLNSGINDAAIIQAARDDAGDPSLTVSPINRVCRCPGSEAAVACTNSCGGGYGPPQYFVEVTASKNVALLFRYPGLPTTIAVARMSAFRVQ